MFLLIKKERVFLIYKKGRVNSNSRIISIDEDPSLRIDTLLTDRKLCNNKFTWCFHKAVFTMQTYKKPKTSCSHFRNTMYFIALILLVLDIYRQRISNVIRNYFILANGSHQIEPLPSPSTTESSDEGKVLKKPKIAPGFFFQLWVFMRRESVLQLRMYPTLLLDQVLTLIAGAAVGLLFREVRAVHRRTRRGGG